MSPEDHVKALAEPGSIEATVSELDAKAKARQLLLEALPQATMSLIEIASACPNQNVRLKAATYIVERGLGPVAKGAAKGEADPIGDLVEEIERAMVNEPDQLADFGNDGLHLTENDRSPVNESPGPVSENQGPDVSRVEDDSKDSFGDDLIG